MQKDSFREYLINKIENKPIGDYISRCERVEYSLHIDLDEEYQRDRGQSVLLLLSYSKDDERDNLLPECGISFEEGASIYNGLSSLRTAIRKYFEYCNVKND